MRALFFVTCAAVLAAAGFFGPVSAVAPAHAENAVEVQAAPLTPAAPGEPSKQPVEAAPAQPAEPQAAETRVAPADAATVAPVQSQSAQAQPPEAQPAPAQPAEVQPVQAQAKEAAESPPAAAPQSPSEAAVQQVKEQATEPAAETVHPTAQHSTEPATQQPNQPAAQQAASPAAPSTAPQAATTAPPQTAQAQSACPGNPDAIGTSRVLAINPADYMRVGVMQYPQSLPLADHEVVLTFDDGPLPPHTYKILDIMASQCVKATYFMVGEMARHYPEAVRRVYAGGHTIGTHSETHPLRFDRISVDRMRREIDDGIADVGAALGDSSELAPFFRFPGLGRTNVAEALLADRGLATFSSDTVADDWRHVSAARLVSLAISRLERLGHGILLLHDIHATTANALPDLLKQLKEHGFHIVHVVPVTTARIAVRGPNPEPNWPAADFGLMTSEELLPTPDAEAFDTGYSDPNVVTLNDMPVGETGLVEPANAIDWPVPARERAIAAAVELPVPDIDNVSAQFAGLELVGEAAVRAENTGANGRGRRHVAHQRHGRGGRQHAEFSSGFRQLTAMFSGGSRRSQQ